MVVEGIYLQQIFLRKMKLNLRLERGWAARQLKNTGEVLIYSESLF